MVQLPFQRVVRDVLAEAPQIGLVPDDMLVIIALPDRRAWGLARRVDFPRRHRFEILNDRPEGGGLCAVWP